VVTVLNLFGPLSKKEEKFIRQMGIGIVLEKDNEYCSLTLPDGWEKVVVQRYPVLLNEWETKQKREESCMVLDENKLPKFMVDHGAIPYQIKLRYLYACKVLIGRRGLLVRITERGKIINGFSVPFSKKQKGAEEKIWVKILEANAVIQCLALDHPEWTKALS
jgi:hypothetical protein